jgi:hypothetical protein
MTYAEFVFGLILLLPVLVLLLLLKPARLRSRVGSKSKM